ncbi:MAG: cyclohydrolase [Hyphomicrobiales bacterium]|nr:cyclohydrolase [Hyphomicrobiales bacterium]
MKDRKPSLIGGAAFGHIQVERAIAEVRSGRPVLVTAPQGAMVATSFEALDDALVAELALLAQGRARLVLAAPRLRRLGVERQNPGFIALPTIELARVSALSVELEGRIDAPVACLTPADEAALELARLALVLPAVVTVPIDAEAPQAAGLLRVSSEAIAQYRAEEQHALKLISRAPVPLEGATDSEFVIFRGGEGLRDQVAVIVGKPDFSGPVTVRLHSACLTGDLFGSLKCDCGDQLRHTAKFMAENGGGVLLYLDQEGRGNGISNKIRAYRLQAQGFDTYDADEVLGFDHDQRGFAFAGLMLKQLGVSIVRVMTNNPVKIAALEDAGLIVAEDQRIVGRLTDQNVRYLASKRDRAGHFIDMFETAPPAHGGAKD